MYEALKSKIERLYRRIYQGNADRHTRAQLRKCLKDCRKEYRKVWHVYVRHSRGKIIVVSYDEFIPRERALNQLEERLIMYFDRRIFRRKNAVAANPTSVGNSKTA